METVYRSDYRSDSGVNTFLATLMRVVWFLAYLLEGFLALRFVLEAIGARVTGFTNFIYSITSPFVSPFRGIVPATTTATNGGFFDWSTIITMVVYWLVAWAATKLLSLAWQDNYASSEPAAYGASVANHNTPAYFEDEPTIIRDTPNYTDYRVRKTRRA